MEPGHLISLVAVLSTFGIALANILVGMRRERRQEEKDERLRQLGRVYVPRADVELRCNFSKPQKGSRLAEILVVVANKGAARREFGSIRLRLNGISVEDEIGFWGEPNTRAEFPIRLMSDDLIAADKKWFYFVEPGVTQTFTYVTKIPENISAVLLHVRMLSRVTGGDTKLIGADPDEAVFLNERMFVVPRDNDGVRPGGD